MRLLIQWEDDDKIKQASLYDICLWFIEKYPEDIFVDKNNLVNKVRDLCKEIIKLKKAFSSDSKW